MVFASRNTENALLPILKEIENKAFSRLFSRLLGHGHSAGV
ncbi:hypothetical protein HMPREF1587_00203 [Bifidobacterium breve JCP7499]|uniref:Uncharacterized protein n=1 Tax=Bifidobacterium breve DSM 20213 = JCM 1192 TaxID=518634 RepID=D4BLY4_BIFBR|nr:hypothetical protein BIFBRE_03071 [Bifidobacterium breve DSM 20213 = JCM 1192]ERI88195.1 hypothetical protein HMPREF1587_00203 [Bifidobacterium breve JCP7499]